MLLLVLSWGELPGKIAVYRPVFFFCFICKGESVTHTCGCGMCGCFWSVGNLSSNLLRHLGNELISIRKQKGFIELGLGVWGKGHRVKIRVMVRVGGGMRG